MIETIKFAQKSGNVLGVMTASITLATKRKLVEKTILQCTITDDDPQTINLHLPTRATPNQLREMANIMLKFADQVEDFENADVTPV